MPRFFVVFLGGEIVGSKSNIIVLSMPYSKLV